MERILTPEHLQRTLAIVDLTDPTQGIHAINIMLDRVIVAIEQIPDCPHAEVRRHDPIVSIADNYDRLYFPPDNVGRSPIYTRYVSETHLLRTHTSSAIPNLLLERQVPEDRLLVCPGICYRRDVVDRTHVGEPHQVDIWRTKRGVPRLERAALIELIEAVVNGVMPGSRYRANEVKHPYTINGLEVEIFVSNTWLEILECGEIHPDVLRDAGRDPNEYSGLAMGIGLDRLVMIAKGIDDIRLLRAQDPRIQRQMTDLEPYLAVSKLPPIRNDMSIAVDPDTKIEDLCDIMKNVLGNDASVIEEVAVLSETPYDKLPVQAIERIGMLQGQKNMLIRVIFRSHERTLTQEEVNRMRDQIYKAVHQGNKYMLTTKCA